MLPFPSGMLIVPFFKIIMSILSIILPLTRFSYSDDNSTKTLGLLWGEFKILGINYCTFYFFVSLYLETKDWTIM